MCRYVQGVAQTASAPVELAEGGIHVRRELLYGKPEVRREVSVLKYQLGDAKHQVGIVVGVGRRLVRRLPVGTRDHDQPGCGGRGFSGGGGMLGRAEKVTVGAMVVEGLVAAGTVGPRGRVAAGAVETAEVSGARSCGVVGVSKVETLAEAGCCAAGATKSRGWPKLAAVQRGRQKS